MQKVLLKKNAEHQRKAFSPWIFRDELEFTQKNYVPGDLIEVQTSSERFYALGYMNPESQIAVRILSHDQGDLANYGGLENFLTQRFLDAWRVRHQLGKRNSFRLVFSESDFLPGYIVDLYRVRLSEGKEVQVFAMQVLTAGAEKIMSDKVKFFENLVAQANSEGLTDLDWNQSALVLRNDVKVREKEGLRVEEPRFLKSLREFEPQNAKILMSHDVGGSDNEGSDDGDSIEMICDLYEGQKTGFFLDQFENIQKILKVGKTYFQKTSFQKISGPLRILDLCCYVGHWSSHLLKIAKSTNQPIEIHLVDVSEEALKRAKMNAENQIRKFGLSEQAQVFCHKGDVLKYLEKFEAKSFDLVIADPPGFIKAKKDMENGKSAYIRLNTESLKLVKSKGLFVSCSCSGLLDENGFAEVISKSFVRAGRRGRVVVRGGSSVDHPAIVHFPQSMYLKMFGFVLT